LLKSPPSWDEVAQPAWIEQKIAEPECGVVSERANVGRWSPPNAATTGVQAFDFPNVDVSAQARKIEQDRDCFAVRSPQPTAPEADRHRTCKKRLCFPNLNW
jgi:hypothetical protein